MPELSRAIIFANGPVSDVETSRAVLRPGDLLIAADGGARHCQALGLAPHVLLGDLDSLSEADALALQAVGVEIVRHPARKDFTDLELALRYAVSRGAREILVWGALGARWDQTVANLLLPAIPELRHAHLHLLDGLQEIALLRGGQSLHAPGSPGDTLSLIPLGGDARVAAARGLEYPLENEILRFGATRGISNRLLESSACIELETGLLLCIIIRQQSPGINLMEIDHER